MTLFRDAFFEFYMRRYRLKQQRRADLLCQRNMTQINASLGTVTLMADLLGVNLKWLDCVT